ncbi:hypothetical protein ACA910_008071 [Epithemia clementina (nom. ined.)]
MSCFDDDVELTAAEKEELEATREALRDVYGSSSADMVGDAKVEGFNAQTALQQLQYALSVIPEQKRRAYDEAQKKCPHLVEKESNPERFLRALGFDPFVAAQQICVYWEKRFEIFQDRAFLPMDQTGYGAISEDILEAMKCGAIAILPPDSKNRPILYCDRSRFCNRCKCEETRLRIMFYTLHVLFESDLASGDGYVILNTMDTSSHDNKHNTPGRNILRLFQSGAFPLKLRAFHLLVFKKRSLIEGPVPIWLNLLARWKFISLRTVVFFAESKEASLRNLKQYHLMEENIPRELGGTLDYDKYFKRWPEMCFNNGFEWTKEKLNRPKVADVTEVDIEDQEDEETKDEDLPELDDDGGALESLAVAATQVRNEEVKARKRRLDVLYQRKKRKQRKLEFSGMAKEAESLKRNNAALKKEHAFLESLVNRAANIAKTCDQIVMKQEEISLPKPEVQQATTQPSPMNVLNQLLSQGSTTSAPAQQASHQGLQQPRPQQPVQTSPFFAAVQRMAEEARMHNTAFQQQQGQQPLDIASFLQGGNMPTAQAPLQGDQHQQRSQPLDFAAMLQASMASVQTPVQQRDQQRQQPMDIASFLRGVGVPSAQPTVQAPTAHPEPQQQQHQPAFDIASFLKGTSMLSIPAPVAIDHQRQPSLDIAAFLQAAGLSGGQPAPGTARPDSSQMQLQWAAANLLPALVPQFSENRIGQRPTQGNNSMGNALLNR